MQSIKKVALALLVMLAACTGSKHEVNVDHRNFDTEIDKEQNLVFSFDKTLVPDSVLNNWDTTAYLNISPAIPGKYKWNTNNELVFSPLYPFANSTNYKVSLNNSIFKFSKEPFHFGEQQSFDVHTPYIKMQNANAYWRLSEKFPGSAAVAVTLHFNYPVQPSVVSKFLQVNYEKSTMSFEIEQTSPSNNIDVVIDQIGKEKVKAATIDIILQKGFKCADSDYLTSEAQQLQCVVPSPDNLEITQVLPEFQGSQGLIHVYTTQAVKLEGLQDFIQVSPSINFEIENADNGFALKGNFSSGSSYSLTIKKNLQGALGGTLLNDFVQQVNFGEMDPYIAFANNKGLYLSSKSGKNIAVNIVNVPKVNVTIWRVYENNIIHFLNNNRYNDEWYGEEDDYGSSSTVNVYGIEKFGDVILNRTYDSKDLAKVNNNRLLNLNFDDINPYRGVYIVRVSSSEDQWLNAIKMVSISDIGLIVKHGEKDVMVFANSIKTAEPLSNVSVSLVSSNNQTLMKATTNGDGVAVFSNAQNKTKGFSTSMVTAKLKKDFNYLMYSDARVNNSRFEVGGRRNNSTGYMAFMYGDRNIYRPGETIHINSVVRNEKWEPVSGEPVKLRLLLPNGREFKNMRLSLNKQGASAADITLAQSAVTGNYVAEISTANDILLQSYNISVEEFIPDRIDVKLNVNKEFYLQGDSIIAKIAAVNMYGPPAANRKYETELNLSRKSFLSKDFPGYNFNVKTKNNITFNKEVREGVTDANGLATEKFIIPQDYKNIGVLSAKLFTTVFDETGRPVNRMKAFDVYTQPVLFGIKMNETYVDRGTPFTIPFAAVNATGKGVNAKAHIQIVRFDWYSSVERDEYGSSYRYLSRKKERVLMDQNVNISASGYQLSYTPRESGQYEVRIMGEGSDVYVAETFYSYGWGYTSNTSFEVNTEGQIDISLDKEKYEVGDDAKILFKTPFNGKLLVTIECNGILEYKYLNTDKKAATMTLPVSADYLPNVYVTATLFRPLDDGSIPITVGHGFMPLMVEKKENHLPVSIVAAASSRSKTKQTITVKTLPKSDIEVTIAVVDEGILALKNYKTPDPYQFFYQKRALQVNAYDIYPNLLPDLGMRKSSSGGDGYDLEKRVNPLSNKRVNLVALWSGILKTNSAGEVKYTIDLPQFSGAVRIMACAYKDKSFGSADAQMKVADPVVISPGIPRFFSPGDTLTMPVTLTNTTKENTSATASISVNGPVKLIGNSSQNISLNAGAEGRAYFKLYALPAVGNAAININVKAFNENFSDKTEITVRPSTSLLKTSGSGELSSKSVISLKNDFIPSSVDGKLIITNNPLTQFGKQLNYLLGYPYGCIEQTTSKAFPQLYYADLVSNMKFKNMNAENPTYNVQEAIRKLQGMQLYNGGFSYWPGGNDESWWGTVYATHFLIEAKRAGYEVSSNIIDRAMSYMSVKVKQHKTNDYYYYYTSNGYAYRAVYAHENIYSLYIMAIYGKTDLPSMNFFKANKDKLATDNQYMLACTYLLLGDRKSYESLLPSAFNEQSRKAFGGSFYSYIRDQAITLNVLLEADPANPQIPQMVRHLSEQVSKEQYINTQEAAFSFLAMGKYLKRLKSSEPVTASIKVGGKEIAKFSGNTVELGKDVAGKDVEVNIQGNGKLFYFWEQEGLSATGQYKEEDNYMAVRKSFYNRFGQSISLTNVKQGDLIVVKISLASLEKSFIENVVVTDMLPAGFEIENPRLNEMRDMAWIKDATNPDYFDVRDDRINFFTNLGATNQYFYYMVRAVSTGQFKMGPVSADAMYNGEYHSYNGAGSVTVK